MSKIADCIRIALSVLLLAASVSAPAQSPVFRGDTLTEAALINALVPRPGGVRTRDIAGGGPGSGSASVLVTFRTNSAAITPEARVELDIIAGALQTPQLSGFGFFVEGHADPRGPDWYNLSLSERRAQSVVAYLAQVRGVAPQRLTPVGKGETEQLYPDNPTAPENRRVTIKTKVQ